MAGELDSLADQYSDKGDQAVMMQVPTSGGSGVLDDLAAKHAPEQPVQTGNIEVSAPELSQEQMARNAIANQAWAKQHPTMSKYITKGTADLAQSAIDKINPNIPTQPAQSAADWLGRVVPESVYKLPGRLALGAYEAVKGQTQPVVDAVGNLISNPSLTSAAQLAASPLGIIAPQVPGMLPGDIGKYAKQSQANAAQSLQGLAQGTVAPTGLLGYQKAKEAWTTDPAGSALALAPLASKGVRASAIEDLGKAVPSPIKAAAGAVSPESLYASALKMRTGKTLSIPERAARTKTGLEGGYIPNEAGYNKLLDDISDVNSQISNKIKEASTANKMVSVDAILQPLESIRERAQYDINPQPLMEKINLIESNLREHPLGIDTPEGRQLPVDVAQKMKIETYRGLRKAYGEMQSTEIEARKAVARGLKEQIVDAVPELASLNAKDSSLINLEDSLAQATKRIKNRDMVGLGGPLKIAGGSLIDMAGGHGLGVTSGALLWALDNPIIKSKLAVSLYRARNAAGKAVSMPKIRAEVDSLSKKLKDERGLVGPDINAPAGTGTLRPATVRGGKVWVAPEGKTHYDVNQSTSIPFDAATQKPVGFVTPEGQFLDRQQSLDWLRQNRPDVYKALDSVTKKKGLESQAYAHAAGIMTPEAMEMRDFMRRQFGK